MMTEKEKQVFCVSGMSCAACSARIENTVGRMPGIRSVQVSLLARRMVVHYDSHQTSQETIAETVRKLGYGAIPMSEEISDEDYNATTQLRRRLIGSAIMLGGIMLFHHYGRSEWGGWIQLFLLISILYLNRIFFQRGVGALLQRVPNMDTLVSIGVTAAVADGICDMVVHHRGELYFESAAMILTLITLGKWLEARATSKTTAAIEKLSALLPAIGTVLKHGKPQQIPAEAVREGDIVLISPGESIPVDGIVQKGNSSANEAALTGESIPSEKTIGAQVYAGTTNGNGQLQIRCTKTREQSAMADIIRMVGDAATSKAPISRMADRVAGVFVPIIMGIALLSTLCWLIAGSEAAFAISCGIAVLVISCPCALGLATPVAIMVGVGKGAEYGILYRNGEALEHTRNISCMVLDKTGTITQGTPAVSDIVPANAHSEEDLLQLASTAENGNNHPLAKAIINAASECPPHKTDECIYKAGRGIIARYMSETILAGNVQLMQEYGISIDTRLATQLAKDGKTALFFAKGGEFYGTIAVQDKIRADAKAAITALQQMGIRVCMLTGDTKQTATAVATQLGIEYFLADCLPGDKEKYISRLRAEGEVVGMVGDGINDAPALMRADVGISLASGMDIARESADVILMHNELFDIVQALHLSRAVIRNIRQNLFWAFAYNTVAIPLAAGVFFPLCGWLLHPGVAAAAMGLSSLCVVSNALRLNSLHFSSTKQETTMNTITLSVLGMMCPHCEQHVAKAVLAHEGVNSCIANHKDNTVTITLNTALADMDSIKAAIADAGYQVQ